MIELGNYPSNILDAYNSVRRSDFVLAEYKELAEFNIALPIVGGQTISQPTTVLDMLSWLDVQKGDLVLDVGFGSGWTTALLSHLVGPEGKVVATEVNEEVFKFGKDNLQKADIANKNYELFLTREELGLKNRGPFDKILVSASANEIPKTLIGQLKNQGTLVIPVNMEIYEIKKVDEEINITPHEAYIFVPLKY